MRGVGAPGAGTVRGRVQVLGPNPAGPIVDQLPGSALATFEARYAPRTEGGSVLLLLLACDGLLRGSTSG